MRPTTHNATAQFRINGAILAAAETKARQQGMTLPEFMRHAVRNAVSRELEDA